MDEKKLEKWANLLLDTGKRNNLISFRDKKASTVEIVRPSSEILLSKAETSTAFEVFDPKIEDDVDEDYKDTPTSDDESITVEVTPVRLNRSEYIDNYGTKIKKANQVLLYNANVNPVNALRNIDKKARAYLEETGNNVAYIAIGFIHWKESENSKQIYNAPLLLSPINFSNESSISPWYIHMTEDDVIVNPTFNYKIQNEYGITLPEYQDETLTEYLDTVKSIVGKLGWTVSDECKIGIFSFLKMNMYKDLIKNKAAILQNGIVRMLLGESFGHSSLGLSDDQYKLKNPLIELHNVVDADSSQIEAIEMAKAGISFVLQGPPGTGKSQTITNIISECLNDGKKILFVSEKQAALNVVFDKLKKAGLEEFCLELHSYKASKKEVIDNICKTLKASRTKVSSAAETALESKEKSQKELDDYEEELHKKRGIINRSLYQLYEDYASCRKAKEVKVTINDIEKKGEDYHKVANNLLSQYAEFVPSIGYDYKANPWFGYINQDTTYQTFESVKTAMSDLVGFFDSIIDAKKNIAEKYGIEAINISQLSDIANLLQIAHDSDCITPAFYKTEHCQYLYEQLLKMKEISESIISLKASIDTEYDPEIYKINGVEANKRLTREFTGVFARLFNSDYKKIVSDIRINNKNGKKPTYNDAISFTAQLAQCQQSISEFAIAESNIKSSIGSAYCGIDSNWESIVADTARLNSVLEKIGDVVSFNQMDMQTYQGLRAGFKENADNIMRLLADSRESRELVFKCFDSHIYNIDSALLDASKKKINGCNDSKDKLENWFRFYNLYLQMENADLIGFIDASIEKAVPENEVVDAYNRNYYRQWIDYVLHSSPVLMAFNRVAHDRHVENFDTQDRLQFDISKAQIRSEIAAKRPSLDLLASGSAVSMLIREGEKKRKQKSVRTLLAEAGDVIQLVKPCFLMSPLSVSTFLTSENIRFDVVIFDEASQIFPQDAIGAIYRGNQLIVVGDSKQMPPSNFFAATVDTDDDDDEETGDVTDFESILDLCSASMNQQRLRWHYRSRFEELIAFSNKNYYDNDLTTFPSSVANSEGVGIDYYYVENGRFDRKSKNNRIEAEFIVDLVFENIEKYPERSLGVVAFSASQQDLIDRLISRRRFENPSKEKFFRRDAQEPFFVKNLETVQGDERDTIIFSVGYAPDSMGRFGNWFGPLSKNGGERRLNVAVTRAKINVQLVASIHCTDINISDTTAKGTKLLREYLDYAENGQVALERALTVNPYEEYDSAFEEEVCEFLRANGFEVDTQVGCSSFRIDLGLKRPGTSDYVLAIECDGATYHSSRNARDRDRLRQEILESMGWKFYRIWSTDWFKNNAVEKERLLEAAKKALSEETTKNIKGSNDTSIIDDVEDNLQSEIQFEEEAKQKHLQFPKYVLADEYEVLSRSRTFQDFIHGILEIESPLSEDWLLKRIVWYFNREKVTSVVQRDFNSRMYACNTKGIIRRNGFLYLSDQQQYVLRVPADKETKRDIKIIALEEIAAGLYAFIKHNVSVEKEGLYRSLAKELGFSRVADNITARFDEALDLLRNVVEINGNIITLKDFV